MDDLSMSFSPRDQLDTPTDRPREDRPCVPYYCYIGNDTVFKGHGTYVA